MENIVKRSSALLLDWRNSYAKQSKLVRYTIAITIVLGFVLLLILGISWPSKEYKKLSSNLSANYDGSSFVTEAAKVVTKTVGECDNELDGKIFSKTFDIDSQGSENCFILQAKILTGVDKNKYTIVLIPTNRLAIMNSPDKAELLEELPLKPDQGQPYIDVGDKIRVQAVKVGNSVQYRFYDFVRGKITTFWILLFILIVALVAGWRGVRALVGLGFAFLFVVFYTFPAILDGDSPVYVAILSGMCILYFVLFFTHGFNLKTIAALGGTFLALLLAGVLSALVLKTMKITGLAQEENISLLNLQSGISLEGVLIAAFVIGALGVLNDTSISQASTVFEIDREKDNVFRSPIFSAGMRVGRDHMASQVYTLIFAYVGSALPYLLLFSVSGRSFQDIALSEVVAVEIARIIAGSCTLIVTMPITTWLASILAVSHVESADPAPSHKHLMAR